MPRKKPTDSEQSKTKRKKSKTKKQRSHDDEDRDDSDDKGVGPSSSVASRKSNRNTTKQSQKLAFDNGLEDDEDEPTGGQSGYESGWGSLHSSDSEEGLGSWTREDDQMVFADTSHLNAAAATKTQDGETFFDVEGILSWRRHPRRGHPQFRALWAGFPIYANTWEPEQNFDSEGGEIDQFWERVGGRPDDCPKPAPDDPTPLVNSSTDTEELIADEVHGPEARRKVIRQLRKDKVDRRKYWQWVRAKEKAEQEAAAAEAEVSIPVAAAPRAGTSSARNKGKGKEKAKEKGKNDKKRKHARRSSSEGDDSGPRDQRATSPKKRKHTIVLSDDDGHGNSNSTTEPSRRGPAGSSVTPTMPVDATTARAASPGEEGDDAMDDLWNEPPGGSHLPPSSPASSTSAHASPRSVAAAVPSKPSSPAKRTAADPRSRPLAPASLRALQGLGSRPANNRAGAATARPQGAAAVSVAASSKSSGSFLDVITGGSGAKAPQLQSNQSQIRQGTTASAAARGSFRGAHKNRKQTQMLLSAPQVPHKVGGVVGATTTVPLRSEGTSARPAGSNTPTQAPPSPPPPPLNSAQSGDKQPRNGPASAASTEGTPLEVDARQMSERREGGRTPSNNNDATQSHPPSQPRSNGNPRPRPLENTHRSASELNDSTRKSGESADHRTSAPGQGESRGPPTTREVRPSHPNTALGPGAMRNSAGAPNGDPRSNDPYAHIFVPSRDPRRTLQPIKTTAEPIRPPGARSPTTTRPQQAPRSADPRPQPRASMGSANTLDADAAQTAPMQLSSAQVPPWARERMRMQPGKGMGVPAWVARAHQQRGTRVSTTVVGDVKDTTKSLPTSPTVPAAVQTPRVSSTRPPHLKANGTTPSSPTTLRPAAREGIVTCGAPIRGAGAPSGVNATDATQNSNSEAQKGMTPSSAPSPGEEQRPTFRHGSVDEPFASNEPQRHSPQGQDSQQLPPPKPASLIPLPPELVPLHVPTRDPRRRKM